MTPAASPTPFYNGGWGGDIRLSYTLLVLQVEVRPSPTLLPVGVSPSPTPFYRWGCHPLLHPFTGGGESVSYTCSQVGVSLLHPFTGGGATLSYSASFSYTL